MPSVALVKLAEAMADQAWDAGNPEVVNAVLVFETVDGGVRCIPWIKGNKTGFGHAVMRTGATLLDGSDGLN